MRSSILRQIVDIAARDTTEARQRLTDELRAADGPLREALGEDKYLVTFVIDGATDQPAVLSGAFPWIDGQIGTPMQAVRHLDGAWYVETVLPAEASVAYQFLTSPLVEPEDWADPEAAERLTKTTFDNAYADPNNPDAVYPMAAAWDPRFSRTPPSATKWESILSLPDAEPFRLHLQSPSPGHVHHVVLRSQHLGNERHISVWTPPDFNPQTPGGYQVVVLLDGEWLSPGLPAENFFANLTSFGLSDGFIAVLVNNAGPTTRQAELTCNEEFTSMIADELVPLIRHRWPTRSAPIRLDDRRHEPWWFVRGLARPPLAAPVRKRDRDVAFAVVGSADPRGPYRRRLADPNHHPRSEADRGALSQLRNSRELRAEPRRRHHVGRRGGPSRRCPSIVRLRARANTNVGRGP